MRNLPIYFLCKIDLLGKQCEDVDECADGRASCGEGGQCRNEPGGFRCLCAAGMEYDEAARRCADVDECATMGEEEACPGGGR